MREPEIETGAEIAQTEKLGLGDLAIAGLLGALTWLGLFLWEFPGILPSLWNDVVVSAGLRPAAHVMPGFAIAIQQAIYTIAGLNGAETVFRQLGHLALAGLVAVVYFVLREMLAFIMRTRPQFSRRRTMVMRLAAAVGATAFAVSDPVWTMGQCFGESTILSLLTLGSIGLFFIFLRKGSIGYAYVCSLLLGLLSAESTLGFVLPILFIALNLFIINVVPTMESPFFKPAVIEVGKWHMTFLYLVGLLGGVALNCWTFVSHHGLGAIGETLGALPLAYVTGYWNELCSAAGPSAWLLWIGICLGPFVVTAIRFPGAADEERFLPYATGMVFFVCGVLAVSQSAFLSALWFWSYFPVHSDILLVVGLFCCAVTMAGSVTILGVDALCRNHQRLAKQMFGNDEDEGVLHVSRSSRAVSRVGIVVVPLFLVALMLPGRFKPTMRDMLALVQDAVSAIVREAGDARFLFTAGSLDAALELESAKQGGSLACYSLMGGSGSLAGYLRTRGLADEEDRFSFGFDAGMGLRSWIRDKPARLRDAAAMMGFDLWKRDGKPLPPMGGLLSRPSGFASEEVRRAGIDVAHDLAARVLEIHSRRGGIKTCTDTRVTDAFLAVQWRLARMCLYRSEADDLAGRAESAIAEARLAKRLNDCNSTYQQLVKTMEKRSEQLLQKLTPREGLQLALVRADFTLGKLYAETILGSDPENPDANFAMGMYYQKERQLSRAETYLKRCLIRKPTEPAIYNNLAMLQIELGKFGAAEVNLQKALSLAPGSAAVLDTKKALAAAIERKRHPPKASQTERRP